MARIIISQHKIPRYYNCRITSKVARIIISQHKIPRYYNGQLDIYVYSHIISQHKIPRYYNQKCKQEPKFNIISQHKIPRYYNFKAYYLITASLYHNAYTKATTKKAPLAFQLKELFRRKNFYSP